METEYNKNQNAKLKPSPIDPAKKIHFVSLGCPKNLVDTEIMLGAMVKDGYEISDSPEIAETIVINTCGFIEQSKQESISKIIEMAELKKSGKLKNLVVAGCLSQRYKEELVEGLPEADVFIGSGEFQRLPEILKDVKSGKGSKSYFNLPTYLQEEATPRINSQPRHRAYLKISEGCKKRCAFCAIPLIRGNLQSRKLSPIINEAKLLVAGGVKELLIISHDFTDFGWDQRKKDETAKESPVELLRQLSDHSGAEWIRVLYLYPDGITDEMIELIRERKNLVKYFDMPLQHINNEVLKNMNRRMTKEIIMERIARIRDRIPEAVLRTQFIVGYPGETEAQFEELAKFVEEMRFDRVGSFAYSQEENTKAGELPLQLDEETKARRQDTLMKIQRDISFAKHKEYIGRIVPVIIEGYSEETDLLLVGRNSQQAPEIDGVTYINSGTAKVGEMVNVKITDSHDYDLVGEIVETTQVPVDHMG